MQIGILQYNTHSKYNDILIKIKKKRADAFGTTKKKKQKIRQHSFSFKTFFFLEWQLYFFLF